MLNFTLTGFADEASQSLTGQIAALKRNGMGYFEPRGIDGKNIADLCEMDLVSLHRWINELLPKLSPNQQKIGEEKTEVIGRELPAGQNDPSHNSLNHSKEWFLLFV